MGRPAEGLLASDCRRHGVRYGIMVSRDRYRLFDCDPSATTGEWLDLDADLLGEQNRPYLALLSPRYLAEGGLAELQTEAEAFGAELRKRLDHTIRQDALPALAEGLDYWTHQSGLDTSDDGHRAVLPGRHGERPTRSTLHRTALQQRILPRRNSGGVPNPGSVHRAVRP